MATFRNVVQDKMIRELPVKSVSDPDNDWLVIEGKDGTKKIKVKDFMSNSLDGNLFFDSLEELKNAVNVTEGSVVFTKGLAVPGDGGAARYDIVYNPAEADDGYEVVTIVNKPTLKAHIVIENGITPEQLGAAGDGITDDTDAIERILRSKYQVLFKGNRRYKITKDIKIPNGKNIDFNGSTIVLDNSTIVLENVEFVNLRNVTFTCIGNGNGIYINKSSKCSISKCNFNGIRATKYGVDILDSSNIMINECNFYNDTNGGTAININARDNTNTLLHDIRIMNCTFKNIEKCLYVNSLVDMGTIIMENDEITYNSTNSECIGITLNATAIFIFKNITIKGGYELLKIGTGVRPNISLYDIHVKDSNNAFCFSGNKECEVHIIGNNTFEIDDNINNNKYLFEKINNKVFLDHCSINNKGYTPINTAYINTGYIKNTEVDEMDLQNKNLSGTTGTLNIDTYKDMYYNITGYDLFNIVGGIEGQKLTLISSESRLLKGSSSNIVQFESGDTILHQYNKVMLLYLDGKWKQIR